MTAEKHIVATTEYLQKELTAAEKALEENERKFLSQEDHVEAEAAAEPVLKRLKRLDREADDLLLTKEAAEWAQSFAIDSTADLETELESLEALGSLLCRHENKASELYRKLYEEEYLRQQDYLQSWLIASVRKDLKTAKYPLPEGCSNLLWQCKNNTPGSAFQSIATNCNSLTRLEEIHRQVTSHVRGTSAAAGLELTLAELARPFVERVKFHFVDSPSERPTSKRIDRLPEWLLNFLKDHIFESGAWELISEGLMESTYTNLALDFLNEVIRMVSC
jgi:hypothetical protein